MGVRVAINGFGRTGRAFFRAVVKSPYDVDVVAVNDLGAPEALARLLCRDSVHGQFPLPISVDHETMTVGSSSRWAAWARSSSRFRTGKVAPDAGLQVVGLAAISTSGIP